MGVVIVRVLPAGFMMSNFEADESDGLKGQHLPFAGWEDPPLAALHHLHQVSHNHCFSVFQAHSQWLFVQQCCLLACVQHSQSFTASRVIVEICP